MKANGLISSIGKAFLPLLAGFLLLPGNLAADPPGGCVPGKACGYTMGFWGNAGGNTCDGDNATGLINDYLNNGDLVVGRGSKTLTFTSGDAGCIIDFLPAGSTADAISSGPNDCDSYTGFTVDNQGKIENVLIGQVIALTLNVYHSPELGLMPVVDSLVVQDLNCNDNAIGQPDDWFIAQSVVDYLGSGADVRDLLDLANDALGGVYTPSGSNPTYSDINNAVDAYNNMFNECQKLVYPTPPQDVTISLSATDLECSGDNSGSIELTILGGNPDYTFSWSNGATTQNISGLAAGTYSVTITDGNGCTGEGTATVNEPDALVASITGTDLLCNGDNTGAADLSVSGGSAPYSYSWSNGETTEDLSGLAAGSYGY
jgi:hypothetical protein